MDNVIFDITAYLLVYAPSTTLSYKVTIELIDPTQQSSLGHRMAFNNMITSRLLQNRPIYSDLLTIMKELPEEKFIEVETYFEHWEID